MRKILLALQSEGSNETLHSFEAYCARKKRDDVFELATSVLQVRQMLATGEYGGMIMQYQLGAVPLTAEEVVSFRNRNEKMPMVIIVPNEIKGGTFLNSLLIECIYGAVYASEGRVPTIMKLIDVDRSRSEAKAYYGILDTVVSTKEANDMPQYATAQNIVKYKTYLESGEDRPIKERFEYIVSKVSMQEVKDMVKTLEPDTIDELRKYPGLTDYLPPLPVKEDKKKKGGLLSGLFGKKKDEPKEVPVEEVKPEPGHEAQEEPEEKPEPKEKLIDIKNDTADKPKAPKKAFEKPAHLEEEPVKEFVPEDSDEDIATELSAFFDLGIPSDTKPKEEPKPVPKPEPKPKQEQKQEPKQEQKQEQKQEPKQEQKQEPKQEQKPGPEPKADTRKKDVPAGNPEQHHGPTEKEKAEAERKRLLEEERIRREEKIRNDATRAMKEEAERQRAEAERKAKEEKERLENEKARILKEQQEAEAKAKAEKAARESAEAKANAEKEAREKAEAEKAEAERKAFEDKRRIAEAEKQAQFERERAEAEKARLLKEQQIKENRIRLEQQKLEAALKAEAEQKAAEAERKVKEEAARREAELKKQVEEAQKAAEAAKREAEKREKEAEKRIQLAESNVRTVVQKQMVSRRVVGVFGLYKGFDSMPIAVQLAKTLSQYEPVTYIEVPRKVAGVYTRFGLEKNVGPSYKSVPHMVANGEANLSTVRNMYGDINFFAANDAYGELGHDTNIVSSMVNGTSDNVVLEAGCTIEEARKSGLLNLCSKAILLYDYDEEERYMSRILEESEMLEASGIEPYILSISAKGNEMSRLSAEVLYSPVRKPDGDLMGFLGMKIPEETKLLGYLGLAGAQKVKKKKQSVKIEIIGTRDIAVFGAERGNGVTHTCLMLADSVRKDYRTALIELNPTKHLQAFAQEMQAEDETGQHMNLYGIDVYYNISWEQFATKYRPKYQIVVIDFGSYTNAYGKQKNGHTYRPIVTSCPKKYLVFDASPWRLSVLDKMVPILDGDSDPACQIELLAPMTTGAGLKQYRLYDRVGHREIHCMPDCEMPVRCEKELKQSDMDFLRNLVLR